MGWDYDTLMSQPIFYLNMLMEDIIEYDKEQIEIQAKLNKVKYG